LFKFDPDGVFADHRVIEARAALANEDGPAGAEASTALRGLIESIVLTPTAGVLATEARWPLCLPARILRKDRRL